MNTHRFSVENLQTRYSFRIVLLVCAIISVAATAAITRGSQRETPDRNISIAADSAGLVDLIVAGVQGTTLTTDGGLMIDISGALFSSIGGERLDAAALKPGMRIRVSLALPDDSASPLVAKFVQLRLENEIVLVSRVQAIDDSPNGSITLLNRRIGTSEAVIVSSPQRRKLKVGRIVTVVARVEGANLVATQIYLDDPYPFIGAGML
jgi:hypothetical protein